MKIFYFLSHLIVFFVSFVTSFLPVKKKKVLLISNFSNTRTDNYEILYNALRINDYETFFLLEKLENTIIGKFKFLFFCLKQAVSINVSEVVIIDSFNIALNWIIKKENTKIIQLWHASGAIKKFGHHLQNRAYEIKPVDYVVVTSSDVKEIYAEALNTPIDRVLPLGNLRTDKLFDSEWVKRRKLELRKKYKIKTGEIIVLYAPTLENHRNTKNLYLNLEQLSNKLPTGVRLAYRSHPRITMTYNNQNILNISKEELIDSLILADVLITDYSSIICEYSIISNKIILYFPDYEEYSRNVGFYLSYEQLESVGTIVNDMDEIINLLDNVDSLDKDLTWFRNRNFDFTDGKSVKRLMKLIDSICNSGDI